MSFTLVRSEDASLNLDMSMAELSGSSQASFEDRCSDWRSQGYNEPTGLKPFSEDKCADLPFRDFSNLIGKRSVVSDKRDPLDSELCLRLASALAIDKPSRRYSGEQSPDFSDRGKEASESLMTQLRHTAQELKDCLKQLEQANSRGNALELENRQLRAELTVARRGREEECQELVDKYEDMLRQGKVGAQRTAQEYEATIAGLKGDFERLRVIIELQSKRLEGIKGKEYMDSSLELRLADFEAKVKGAGPVKLTKKPISLHRIKGEELRGLESDLSRNGDIIKELEGQLKAKRARVPSARALDHSKSRLKSDSSAVSIKSLKRPETLRPALKGLKARRSKKKRSTSANPRWRGA
jgi:hypothetical protein